MSGFKKPYSPWDSKRFFDRLAFCVSEKGWSMNYFTEQLEINRNTLAKDKRNKVMPSMDVINEVLRVLDVSFEYFFAEPEDESDRIRRQEEMMERIVCKAVTEAFKEIQEK